MQLLIGFESGTVVLWDLKSKKADYRYTHDEVTFFIRIAYPKNIIHYSNSDFYYFFNLLLLSPVDQ